MTGVTQDSGKEEHSSGYTLKNTLGLDKYTVQSIDTHIWCVKLMLSSEAAYLQYYPV